MTTGSSALRPALAAVTCPACGVTVCAGCPLIDGAGQLCLLVDDRASASSFPVGDLRLAFCGECGFITNTAFDPSTEHIFVGLRGEPGILAAVP